MTDNDLYSVKMRASRQQEGMNKHISGAEKIVPRENLQQSVDRLLERALHHAKGEPDFINFKIERIPESEILYEDALPVRTIAVDTWQEGREELAELMRSSDIPDPAAILARMEQSWDMRGAMLLNVDTMERMEPDRERGVRATYMDVAGGGDCTRKNHFREALVLATKVASCPHILAELCISDDPDYVTGYFASRELGYVRVTKLKEMGCPDGGRIFLFRGSREDAAECVRYLQEQKMLVRFSEEQENFHG